MFITKKSDYVESLIDYILDTKPYHTKITEIIEEYQFYDNINVQLSDNFYPSIELASHWGKSYVTDGWLRRFLTPSYNLPRYSLESNRHHLTLSDKISYLEDLYNISDCYQLRAARGIESVIINDVESLAEGLDYHISQGMYSFKLNSETQTLRTWETYNSTNNAIIGNLIEQSNNLDPVEISDIIFSNLIPDTWTVQLISHASLGFKYFDVSSYHWEVTHVLHSPNIVWQAYIETGLELEAVITTNALIVNDNQLDINFTPVLGETGYTGSVCMLNATSNQIFYVNTPSNIWTIDHNFGTQQIYVQALVNNEYIIPAEIIQLNDNTVELSFTEAVYGKVFILPLPEIHTEINPSATWLVPGNFIDPEKQPLFQCYITENGIVSQIYPLSVNVSGLGLEVTFSSPQIGFISYFQTSVFYEFAVTSKVNGFLGNATIASSALKTFNAYKDLYDEIQSVYFVVHNPNSTSVWVDGIQLAPTEYDASDRNFVEIFAPINEGSIIEITELTGRFDGNGIGFNITSQPQNIGSKAIIKLREQGFTIASEEIDPTSELVEPEKWTLIKVNPISFEKLGVQYSGLTKVEAITHTWPEIWSDIILPEYEYIRQKWKLEVFELTNSDVTFQITNLDTSPIPSVYSQTVTLATNITFDIDPFINFRITVGSRGLAIGDSYIFGFGYDRDEYSIPGYDNGEFDIWSYRGTTFELSHDINPIKLLPLSAAYSHAETEILTLTFVEDGGYFIVNGSLTGGHQIAYLGREYDNGLVRFRLVRSTELFNLPAMLKDPTNYCYAYSQRAIEAGELKNGDKLFFKINRDRPNYLVHCSGSTYIRTDEDDNIITTVFPPYYSKPAITGKYYWNDKIGFMINNPYYSVLNKQKYITTNGQTLITCTYDNTLVNGNRNILATQYRERIFNAVINQDTFVCDYEPTLINVYKSTNIGVTYSTLTKGIDYIATNGTDIILSIPCNTNDLIKVECFGNNGIELHLPKEFIATDNQQYFDLGAKVSVNEMISVFRNGVELASTLYSLDNTSISTVVIMNIPVPANTLIDIYVTPTYVVDTRFTAKTGSNIQLNETAQLNDIITIQIPNVRIETGSITLLNGAQITFNSAPKHDMFSERFLLKFHKEANDSGLVKMRDANRQFLVYSDKRGQLPAALIGERYSEFECAERGAERNFVIDFTINEPNNNFDDDTEFYIDIVSNQFGVSHSQDVLVLPNGYSNLNKLKVNTYQEDLLTIELETIHPELGSYTNLVPTYLVAADDYANYSLGYDGNMLTYDYVINGNILTSENYSNPADTLLNGANVIYDTFVEPQINISSEFAPLAPGVYDGEFAFEPYDDKFVGYDTKDTSELNKPKKQNPVIPDRGYIYDVFLSNVGYQDETKHNKVGTITWQYDPDAKFYRQVIDFTELFASKYLTLNTKLNIKVDQADEYNDLTRVLISERLESKDIIIYDTLINTNVIDSTFWDIVQRNYEDVPVIIYSEDNNNGSFDVKTIQQNSNNAATAISDYGMNVVASFDPTALSGYQNINYDVYSFVYDVSGTRVYFTNGGYEDSPNAQEIFEELPIADGILSRSYSQPIYKLRYELAGSESNIILTQNINGIEGLDLVEGIDFYSEFQINPLSYNPIHFFTLVEPQPISVKVFN